MAAITTDVNPYLADFNMVENRLKEFLQLEGAENICCTPAEKEKLLLLIPLVIQMGSKIDINLTYQDASAILLVVYHSLNLDEWGQPIKVLLLVGEGAMTPSGANQWMERLRRYKRHIKRRVNEIEHTLLDKHGLLQAEKDAIDTHKHLKNETTFIAQSPIEQAEKEIRRIKRAQKRLLRDNQDKITFAAKSICPLRNTLLDRPTIQLNTKKEEDDLNRIMQIIMDIIYKDGKDESTIRRTLLGLDEPLPPWPHDDRVIGTKADEKKKWKQETARMTEMLEAAKKKRGKEGGNKKTRKKKGRKKRGKTRKRKRRPKKRHRRIKRR